VLSVKGLRAGYGDLMVLHGLDLEIRDKECVAVLGPNGAGKSTLMKVIGGAIPVAGGSLDMAGTRTNAERLRRIGWVPEGRMLFSDFTVRDNLWLSARAAAQSRTFKEQLDACVALFPVLGDRLDVHAGTLSGGQQQMVAIARALVRRPDLLILDEPSMGLAPLVLEDIRAALERLRADGLTILIAEQRVNWLTGLLDGVAMIQHGVIAMRGTGQLLQDRDAMRSMYLGA
jgi:branched-chain amino acid transport system ATP-binding protein